jgi:palmitoyl-protein thioesterase
LPQDPYNLDAYLANNIFLPDINNERLNKNQLYADNMASLERLVLVMFEEDTTGEGRRARGSY